MKLQQATPENIHEAMLYTREQMSAFLIPHEDDTGLCPCCVKKNQISLKYTKPAVITKTETEPVVAETETEAVVAEIKTEATVVTKATAQNESFGDIVFSLTPKQQSIVLGTLKQCDKIVLLQKQKNATLKKIVDAQKEELKLEKANASRIQKEIEEERARLTDSHAESNRKDANTIEYLESDVAFYKEIAKKERTKNKMLENNIKQLSQDLSHLQQKQTRDNKKYAKIDKRLATYEMRQKGAAMDARGVELKRENDLLKKENAEMLAARDCQNRLEEKVHHLQKIANEAEARANDMRREIIELRSSKSKTSEEVQICKLQTQQLQDQLLVFEQKERENEENTALITTQWSEAMIEISNLHAELKSSLKELDTTRKENKKCSLHSIKMTHQRKEMVNIALAMYESFHYRDIQRLQKSLSDFEFETGIKITSTSPWFWTEMVLPRK